MKLNTDIYSNLSKLINSANKTNSNYKSPNELVNEMYAKYDKALSAKRNDMFLFSENVPNTLKTYVSASSGDEDLKATKNSANSYTIHFSNASEIKSAVENGYITVNGKEVQLSDNMKEQLTKFGEIAQQRQDAEVQRYNMMQEMEASKQSANSTKEQLDNMLELFTIAQKISKGIIVSAEDEQKLLEEEPKMYALAKTAALSAKEYVLDKDMNKKKKDTDTINPLTKARDLSNYEPKTYEVQLKVSTSGNPSVTGMSIQVATE